MKKAFFLSLMAIATIFTFATTTFEIQAHTNNNKFRLHDSFTGWDSSIFTRRIGNVSMENGTLSLISGYVVTNQYDLKANTEYLVTIDNLSGTVEFGRSHMSGHYYPTSLTGNGSDVSFSFTNSPITSPMGNGGSVEFFVEGRGAASLDSITIEETVQLDPVVYDTFWHWSTSIFNHESGHPNISNNTLTLPPHSRAFSYLDSKNLDPGTYRVTLGGQIGNSTLIVSAPRSPELGALILQNSGSGTHTYTFQHNGGEIHIELSTLLSGATLNYFLIEKEMG